MAKSKKSSKPSGLKITRNGSKFICEWKIPSAKYGDGQQFKATTVDAKNIRKTLTKETVTIDLSKRYPASGKKKLTGFSFSVRGNSDPKKDKLKWSEWAKKEITLHPPKKPSVTAELTGTNKCKFSWTVANAGADSLYPFAQVVIQTKLVKDCTWEPEKDSWKNAEKTTRTSASSYVEYTENSETLAGGNYTRLVRIKAQGCGGNSDWAYAKHVYGAPRQAKETAGTVKEIPGGYDVRVNWDTSRDKSTPIDESVAEWTIATPQSDMSCPDGASWTPGPSIKDTVGKEAIHLEVTSRLGLDQCLYTRVNTKHDSRTTYGMITLQKKGSLTPPASVTVDNVDQESQTARVTSTNASTVNGTVLEVIYRKNGAETIVGLITGSPDYLTVKCPAWTDDDEVSFGVRAALINTQSVKTEDGVNIYTISAHMTSDKVWQTGTIASAPSDLRLEKDEEDVRATWTNNWADANVIELSWSTNPNAWESTDEPDKFEINNPFVTSWRIAGLQTGLTWYARVRSVYDTGNGKTYSPYSNIAEVNLSSAPNIPTLTLSKGIVAVGEGLTASWEYNSTDGTPQDEARIFEYINDEYVQIGETTTQEHLDIEGWDEPGMHWIAVETVSQSGRISGKSDMLSVTVADPVVALQTNSLEDITITDEDETTRTVRSLTEMPLTVSVSGAGTGGSSSVVIRRAEAYRVDRPDESELHGYEGEVIADMALPEDAVFTIELEDLLGTFDDGAKYTLTATATDNIGQSASITETFEVHWSHQALMPSGDVIVDNDQMIARIMPKAPVGYLPTDKCDIYRLSSDKPRLIYRGASFDSSYVDPYPAIGDNGGYRFVFMTANGDYNTAENVLAMYDAEDEYLHSQSTIIDFDGDRVELRYNMSISSDWKKEFTEKKFLGGSVKGYWKEGVSRSSDIDAVAIPAYEEGTIESMRRLSEYVGICNVRTPEGSSFPADVQVSESWDDSDAGKIVKFSLKITRVEPEALDGMTYDEWIGG